MSVALTLSPSLPPRETTPMPTAAAHDDAEWTFPSPAGAIAVESAVRPEGHPDLDDLDPADGWVRRPIGGGLVLALRAGRADGPLRLVRAIPAP